MSESKPLTPRQEAFCRNYIANGFNGYKAAISAGYSEVSALTTASEILTYPNVLAYIAKLQEKTVERAKASADDVFEMITDAINLDLSEFTDVVNVTRVTKAGNEVQRMALVLRQPLSSLPYRVRRLVTATKEGMFGVEVTWFSKEKALEMLARFHGMNNDKVTIKKEGELTDDEKAELEEIRREADASGMGA